MINREDIKKLIEAHGEEETLDICFEECGELIQAISKMKRLKRAGKSLNYINLLSEMADVLISVEMLKEVAGLSSNQVEKAVDVKMKRNMERIEECSNAVSTAKKENPPARIIVSTFWK